MAVKMNLSGTKSIDELDRERFPDAGWYRAKVEDSSVDEKGAEVIVCQIVGGRFDGCKADLRMPNPEFINDEGKAKNALTRIESIATRLGLITKEMIGKADVEINFVNAIGKEIVIECETREFPGDDGKLKKFTGITYTGIYPLDHEKIPEQARKDLNLPPARKKIEQGGYSPPAKPASGGKNGQPAKPASPKKALTVDDV